MRAFLLFICLLFTNLAIGQPNKSINQQSKDQWNINLEYSAFHLSSFNEQFTLSSAPLFNQKIGLGINYKQISLSIAYLNTDFISSGRIITQDEFPDYGIVGGNYGRHVEFGIGYNLSKWINSDLILYGHTQLGYTTYTAVDYTMEDGQNEPNRPSVLDKPTINYSLGGKVKLYSAKFIEFYFHSNLLLFEMDKVLYSERYVPLMQNSISTSINFNKLWGLF